MKLFPGGFSDNKGFGYQKMEENTAQFFFCFAVYLSLIHI